MTKFINEELIIYDKISHLGSTLWAASLKVTGSNRDPKMFSVMLFKRLWSNHRGYTVLHNNKLFLEAEIILRSGIETAICIAANYQLRNEFVVLMRQDAAYTVRGQIKIHREAGENDLVKETEELLRSLRKGLPNGTKPARLNWKELAQLGKIPFLYNFYRMLSGFSSHVTGLSLINGVIDAEEHQAKGHGELQMISEKVYLMMMASATLNGAMLHATMIDDKEHILIANNLLSQMKEISTLW